MIKGTLVLPGLLAGLAVTVVACSDRDGSRSDPAGPLTVSAEAPPVRACSTRDAERLARSYFTSQTDTRAARDLLALVAEGCDLEHDAQVTENGFALLALIEDAVGAGTAGDPSTGNDLVNAIVDCIENRCIPEESNDIQVATALSHGGLFGVRASDMVPVLARAPRPFTDFSGNPNHALFGLEADLPWSTVTGTPHVLFYGSPVSGVIDLADVGFGGLQFDLNRYPIPGTPFKDDGLHVGVCFEEVIDLPHPNGDGTRPAMAPHLQREAVLLETWNPTFCEGALPAVQSASVAGSAVALLRGLLPTSWFAASMNDRSAGSLGGTPLEFSTFAPVAAQVEGLLEFVSQPAARSTEGESIGEIRVRARSGGGTPIEKVLVVLSVSTNEGAPAGAVLSGDIASYTGEAEGVAVFPDDGPALSLGKPGGYRICANATLNGFTFPEVCSDRIHIGNDTGG